MAAAIPSSIAAQPPPDFPLDRAAEATELPLPGWGPYSRSHIGPCCLVDRLKQRQLAFPIVVGQRLNEVIARPGLSRAEAVVLQRRCTGLSPVNAAKDDVTTADDSDNRDARVTEADAAGLLWQTRAQFREARVAQPVPARANAAGNPAPPPSWPAGVVTVTCFPAFAEAGSEGLVIRVEIANRSHTPERYFVDLLGGVDTAQPDFLPRDLKARPDPDGVVLSHKGVRPTFFLAGDSNYLSRYYRVDDRYFSAEGAVALRERSGAVLPAGLTSPAAKSATTGAEARAPRPERAERGEWGLCRVEGITVDSQQSATITLCVGVGEDAGSAAESARAMLTAAGAPARNGLCERAMAAHDAARFQCADPAISRLVAQSLANVPLYDWRRVGVPTRQGDSAAQYQPAAGGMVALGWSRYRPDFAAAQLNAFFLSTGNPAVPIRQPRAIPPTNFLALWELYQQTHNLRVIEILYPFAQRRYDELLSAGASDKTVPIYRWPAGEPAGPLVWTVADSGGPTIWAAEYSAYVVRTAKIMWRLASAIRRPVSEQRRFEHDAILAGHELSSRMWDAGRRRFVDPRAGSSPAETGVSLADIAPLMEGVSALTPEQRTALLPAAWGPLLTADGLRRAVGGPTSERVEGGANWLIWKSLLDFSASEKANELAARLMNSYRTAAIQGDCCPEWVDGATGKPGGATDYSGDACALLAIYQAYHVAGSVSTGWDTDVSESRYDPATDSLALTVKSLDSLSRGSILCVMKRPRSIYLLHGGISGRVTSDELGIVTLQAPAPGSAATVRIEPAS